MPSYDPAHPTMYFSLGEAVGALSLIFAAYQLKSPRWDLALRIRGWGQRNLIWILSGFGALAIIAAAGVTLLPQGSLPAPFSYPITYELLGTIAFVLAPFSFLLFASRTRGLFTPRRAKRFYHHLHAALLREGGHSADVVIDLLWANLEPLSRSLAELRPRWQTAAPADTRALSNEEQCAEYANATLTVLLGDPKVANGIATGRIDFVLALFHYAKQYGVTRDGARNGIDRLLEALLRNDRSGLYTQLDWRGTSLSANIYEAIFSEPFVLRTFSPFSSAHVWSMQHPLTEQYLDVYLKALEHALEAFWDAKCPSDLEVELRRGLHHLGEYCQRLGYEVRGKNTSTEAFARLNQIGMFLGSTYINAYRRALTKGSISEPERNAVSYGDYHGTVNQGYAEAVFEYLQAWSLTEPSDAEQMRLCALHGTMHLLGVSTSSEDEVAPIRIALTELIWEHIAGPDISNIRGFFPPVARAYIALIGLGNSKEGVRNAEYKRLAGFLYSQLAPKIEAGDKMVDKKTTFEAGLLPPQVTFDRATRRFLYQYGHSEYHVIEPPPPDSQMQIESTAAPVSVPTTDGEAEAVVRVDSETA